MVGKNEVAGIHLIFGQSIDKLEKPNHIHIYIKKR
jgi:hypothetical protein